MSADRLAVLTAAMSIMNQLPLVSKPSQTLNAQSTRVLNVLEGISYPSIELLFWMLRGRMRYVLELYIAANHFGQT